MGLSLKEIKILSEIASVLYSFLPGNPHPFADPSISFRGIAQDLGLEMFWQGGSKLPAITKLLKKTLLYEPNKFCKLILKVVQRGMEYRTNKGEPLTKEEIERLNNLLLRIEFKIPELWDKAFLESLPSETQRQEIKTKLDQQILQDLKRKLLDLNKLKPQQRGYRFEELLKEIFKVFGLAPRSSFKISGEQIDGSIEIDNHTYLVEVKWHNECVSEKELLIFHGKIGGKAKWSRGLFISYTGFTKQALEAFVKGKTINLIVMDGLDLHDVLEGKIGLGELIRLKSRYAAETGEIMARADNLVALYLKQDKRK